MLIGNGTAGPAEILAGAIADNHRGDTVGERTFGTASMQKLIQLEDGSALILTVATYYTPAGKEIPAEGVAPTNEVRPSPDEVAAEIDTNQQPGFSGAIVSPEDPVLKKALELLHSAGAARKAA